MPPQQPQQAGSAQNPIEIGGTTPAMSVASLGPGQTPQMGYGQLPGAPQGHNRQPSFGAGAQQQPGPLALQQLQAQQQQAQQQRPGMPNQSNSQNQIPTHAQGQNRGEPNRMDMVSMDFSNEPIPFKDEATLWSAVVKVSGRETLARPLINGQPIDLHKLFTVVHRTGGSLKVRLLFLSCP